MFTLKEVRPRVKLPGTVRSFFSASPAAPQKLDRVDGGAAAPGCPPLEGKGVIHGTDQDKRLKSPKKEIQIVSRYTGPVVKTNHHF